MLGLLSICRLLLDKAAPHYTAAARLSTNHERDRESLRSSNNNLAQVQPHTLAISHPPTMLRFNVLPCLVAETDDPCLAAEASGIPSMRHEVYTRAEIHHGPRATCWYTHESVPHHTHAYRWTQLTWAELLVSLVPTQHSGTILSHWFTMPPNPN
jgi:hypothetical protein